MDSNIKQLVGSLNKTLTEGVNELGEKYQAVQLLPELKKKYSDQLRPEIVSVRFYQTEHACYLETTVDESDEKGISPALIDLDEDYEGHSPKDYRIHRKSLSFIVSEDGPFFLPGKAIEENAAHFLVSMDSWSLVNCTVLFTAEAEEAISERYQNQSREERQASD